MEDEEIAEDQMVTICSQEIKPEVISDSSKETTIGDISSDTDLTHSDSSMSQETQQSKKKPKDDFSDDAYSEPLPDPYGRAIKYLEKHNIMQLFQSLTSSIVYNKPDDPMSFLMSEVAKIKKEREEQKESGKENKSN